MISVAKLEAHYLPTVKQCGEIEVQGVASYRLFYKNKPSALIFLMKSHIFQGSEARYITDRQIKCVLKTYYNNDSCIIS